MPKSKPYTHEQTVANDDVDTAFGVSAIAGRGAGGVKGIDSELVVEAIVNNFLFAKRKFVFDESVVIIGTKYVFVFVWIAMVDYVFTKNFIFQRQYLTR
jgi:hypothetical protein